MKAFITLTSVLALTGFSYAGEHCADGKVCDKTVAKADCETVCDKSLVSAEKDCDYACDKEMKVAATQFVVTGMTCGGCEGEMSKGLAAIEGISDVKVDHETGIAAMKLDEEKASKSVAMSAIQDMGYKVVGQRVSFPMGSACATGCPVKLKDTLAGSEGVVEVESVDEASGTITVIIDPAKTSTDAIAAVANPPQKQG